MISLIAITDSSAPPPTAPVAAVPVGSLCALCVRGDDQPVTIDTLVEREALLDALMEDRDVLPVRFGSAVPDERAAAQVVRDRHDELTAALDQVRGAVELAVRARPAAREGREDASRASGREYLRARAGGSAAATRLHERLEAISRSAVLRPGGDLLRAAYLVDRAAVAEFVAEVQRTQQSCPELSLLCTGPWPPFSFAAPEPTP